MHTIGLGSFGTIEVDDSRFTPEVVGYIFTYGLKQMLNDAHASATAKLYPVETDLEGAKLALAQKKLVSLYAGEIAQARGTRDPVQAELTKMAIDYARGKLAAAGKKWSKLSDDEKATVIKTVLDKNPDWYRQAVERVSARKADVANAEPVDLSDLGL